MKFINNITEIDFDFNETYIFPKGVVVQVETYIASSCITVSVVNANTNAGKVFNGYNKKEYFTTPQGIEADSSVLEYWINRAENC